MSIQIINRQVSADSLDCDLIRLWMLFQITLIQGRTYSIHWEKMETSIIRFCLSMSVTMARTLSSNLVVTTKPDLKMVHTKHWNLQWPHHGHSRVRWCLSMLLKANKWVDWIWKSSSSLHSHISTFQRTSSPHSKPPPKPIGVPTTLFTRRTLSFSNRHATKCLYQLVPVF